MESRLMVLVGLFLFPAVGNAQGRPGDDDTKKLQGVWTVTSTEKNGERLAPNPEVKTWWVIKGDKLVITPNMDEWSFKLGSSKKWKTIDVTLLKGRGIGPPKVGETIRGIYKMEGDVLTICAPGEAAGQRPEEFDSEGGRMIIVLKRLKE